MTVNEYAPDSNQGNEYRVLVKKIVDNTNLTIPTAIEMDELEALLIELGIIETEEAEKLTAMSKTEQSSENIGLLLLLTPKWGLWFVFSMINDWYGIGDWRDFEDYSSVSYS